MKLYDTVKQLLTVYPQLRNSDKKLLWAVWTMKGLVKVNLEGVKSISRESFYKAPSSESVTRARRKIQEEFPHLQATQEVQESREEKQLTKGTFVYRENV